MKEIISLLLLSLQVSKEVGIFFLKHLVFHAQYHAQQRTHKWI